MNEIQEHHHVVCPLCSSPKFAPVSGFEGKHLQRCSNCSLVFDQRIPAASELADHYRQYSYGAQKPCPPATMASYRGLLTHFEKYRRRNRILDIGCGQGDFLASASSRDWHAEGSEFSEAAVALCRGRGLKVHQGALSEADWPDGDFDVITAFEVLEHVNHPALLMDQVARLLRPGGLLYVTTPNFNSLLRYAEKAQFEMVYYPEHICFYTKRSLAAMADLYGFRVNRVLTTGLDLARANNWFAGRSADAFRRTSREAKGQMEALRSEVLESRSLQFMKVSINTLLTLSGTGDTLKGYLVKA